MKYKEDIVKRLIDEADILDVLHYTGVDARRGKNFRCINPAHQDNKASMSIIPNSNVCHCFACGYTANTVKIIRDHLHTGFLEALEILAEIEGMPSWFEPQKKEPGKGIKKPFFYISKDELKAAGLSINPIYIECGISFQKDNEKNFIYKWIPNGYYEGKDDDYYIKSKKVSGNEMMPENEVFAELVETKCKEKLYDNIKKAEWLNSMSADEFAALYGFNKERVLSLMREEYDVLQQIRTKAFEYRTKLEEWKNKTPYWLRRKKQA